MKLYGNHRLATIQILYYRPDYQNILQEFVWQTDDYVPEFPRIHKFLWYWKDNIIATVHSIELAYTDPFGKTHYKNGKDFRIV